jgi:ribonuclease HII
MVRIPTFLEERALHARGFSLVAGVDEAGCGCWAGPVVAAAVILPLHSRLKLIRDSKTLSLDQRLRLETAIKSCAIAWSVGLATPEEIDTLNIRVADALAMRRAVEGLSVAPHYVLSDAFPIPGLRVPVKNLIEGDARVKSIAAASILAKTARDHLMMRLDLQFPGYGFAQHKGYGTKAHQAALENLGVSRIHRKSYAPIKALLLREAPATKTGAEH